MNQYLIPGQIERGIPQPVYQQIYEQLKRELVLGNHHSGSRFFSYRKLKEIYKTELRTIGAAVDLLIRDGLLEKRAASGIYVIKPEKVSEVGNVWYAVLDEQCYHPFFFNILLGLVKEAEKYGLRIIVRFGRDRREFLRWLAPKPGEGVVITGNLDDALLKSAASKCNGNLIVVGNYDIGGNFGQITTNCSGKIRESLSLAKKYGCSRYALVTGSAKTKIARDMCENISSLCRENHFQLKLIEELTEDGFKAMTALRKFKPDCVMLTEPAFSGAWEFLIENSLKCPEDIFLIRYGKESNDRTLRGRAAVEIEIDSEIHGRTALQMLLKNSKDLHRVNMKLISHVKGI